MSHIVTAVEDDVVMGDGIVAGMAASFDVKVFGFSVGVCEDFKVCRVLKSLKASAVVLADVYFLLFWL